MFGKTTCASSNDTVGLYNKSFVRLRYFYTTVKYIETLERVVFTINRTGNEFRGKLFLIYNIAPDSSWRTIIIQRFILALLLLKIRIRNYSSRGGGPTRRNSFPFDSPVEIRANRHIIHSIKKSINYASAD